MAVKGSDQIVYLRTALEWLEKNSKFESWMFYTHQVRDLIRELRLAYRIFCLVEIFLLPGRDDEALESFIDNIAESLYEKGMEIHGVIQEVSHQGSEVSDHTKYQFLFSTFFDAAKIIEPLFGITVDKYNHSSSHRSKHCSMDQLLEFISLVLEDSYMEEDKEVMYKLQFMKDFIRFSASRGVPKYRLNELLVLGEFMVTTAAYYSYMHQIPYEIADKATSKVIETRYSEILRLQPKVRKIYVRVLKATRSSSSSSSSSQTSSDDDVEVIVTFMDSLVENHLELLASSSSFTVSVIKIIVEEMRFLKNFLLYKKRSKDGTGGGDHDRNLVTRTIDLIVEAGIILYSHSWHDDGDDLKLKEEEEEEEELIKDAAAELGFSNWMENVEVFKRDVGMKYPETSRYKFPRTNELGFIDGLLEDLKQFMKRENNTELMMDHHQVLEDLVFLRDFLRKIVRLRHENGDLNALWIRVVDVAYRIEFVVNSMVVGDSSPDCTPASFSAIKEEIKKIKPKVEEIYAEEKKKKKKGYQEIENVSNDLPSRSSRSRNSNSNSTPTMDEFMVGFEDEVKKIIDRIEAKYSNLDIVPIVGMAGQGKTTLAKKVYNDLSYQGKTTLAKKVYNQFQVFAWCCISQGYQKQKWLLDILRGTLGYKVLPSSYETRTEGDLEKDVYQSLKGKKYLIVLDDIWETEAWRGLKQCFPDDNNGSRILLTTRIRDVAGGGGGGTDHVLRFLNDQESWELLRKKLFPKNEDCSEEKERIGTRIAKSCKGLPFAVVMVAGILVAMEKDEEWKDFANGLSINKSLESEEGSEMVELSYVHLPEYLKPCLLYFGAFLQDQVIPVSRLTWLWTAEGFVQQRQETNENESSSSENVAMEYLMDLIKRSLVMAVNKTSRGGIKSCSIHDLVHQFCITKAKDENFQQKLNLSLPGELRAALPEPRRLCIYSERKYFSNVRLTFRHLSSLILFPIGRSIEFYDVSSNFRHFKLLRVLDLRGFICRSFPPGIEKLVQLRFLALVGDITSIPSTIIKLSNLETFLLKGMRGEITLPYNLLNLTKLRHLHVNNRVVFGLSPEEDQNLESCNLESFCTLRLSSSGQEIVKNIIKKIKNIRKLKCSFFGSLYSKEGGYQIPAELSILTKLESLKVHSIGRVSYPLKFSFPVKLRKLTLSNFFLPWERISELAKLLPNLEVLKLLSKACEGETWDMGGEEQVFSNLQFLKMENLDIVHWNAYSENFPRLQVLILSRCNNLEEIPMEMEEVDTLKVIEVKWCKESAATSAQDLQEAIEGLKVFVRLQKSEDKPA